MHRNGIEVHVDAEQPLIDVVLNADMSANMAAESVEEARKQQEAATNAAQQAKTDADRAETAAGKVESDVKYLDKSIAEAKEAKQGLDSSIEVGTSVKGELDSSIEDANTAKDALAASTAKAETADETLKGTIKSTSDAKSELDKSTASAEEQKQALDTSVKAGESAKGELDASTQSAKDAQGTLEGKIEEAAGMLDGFQSMIEGVTVSAEKIPAGGEPTATATTDGNLHITFGLVEGEKGADGKQGADGKSAFDIAKELHPEYETEEQWLASLKGEPGKPGAQGVPGEPGAAGPAGPAGKDASEEQITAAVQEELAGMSAADFGAAETEHKHDAADITTGVLPIARGGTGASTAAAARTNLQAMAIFPNNAAGGTDYNTITESGFYQIKGINPNSPLGSSADTHFHVAVFKHSADWIRQVAYDVRSVNMYTRSKTNKTWSAWQPVGQIGTGAGAHNSIYRGIELGKSVSAEQYAAIASGTFDNMYIGDYWTIDKKVYRIAAFDYWLHCGDNEDITKHHVVLVPDKVMYYAQMHKTSTGKYIADDPANTTDGGYAQTDLYKTGMATAKSTIKAAFPDHVLSHRECYTNAATNGNVTGVIWVKDDVVIMNENMVYGTNILATRSYGNNVLQWNHTTDESQLPLFAMRKDLINTRQDYWLRDIANQRSFAYVSLAGRANCYYASNAFGVRPAFAIFGS